MMVNSREIPISSFLTRPVSAVSSVCRKCAPRKRCDDDEDDEDDDEDDEDDGDDDEDDDDDNDWLK